MEAWFSTSYLVLFGSILAYSCFVWLMEVRSPAQVSTYAYVNPVVAVLLGVFLASEHVNTSTGRRAAGDPVQCAADQSE